MPSINKLLLTLSILCTPILATDYESYPFIGVTVSSESVCIDGEGESSGTFGVNYGIQSVIDRSMLTLYTSGTFTSFGVEYDRILSNDLFMKELRPYAGVNLGIIHRNDDDIEDNYGFYYGLSLGMMLYTSDNIDIDLAYYYNEISGLDDVGHKQGVRFLFHYFY